MTASELPPHQVLVVDDEPMLRNLLCRLLRMEGYDVLEAEDGRTAIEIVRASEPDLVLLDVMLPARNGLDVLDDLRRTSNVPVILVSALGEEADRVLGLKMGADDYVVKPFSPAELVARVEAVLRRTAPIAVEDQPPIVHGPLRVEPASRRVFLDGEELMLTMREFDLLAFFAANPGRVFSRDQLMEAVWGETWFDDTSTVTVHVRRLRAKLGDDPAESRFIETVWGVGYRFRP